MLELAPSGSSITMASEARFLNVDLELRAPFDLIELVSAFSPGAFPLHCGPAESGFLANLELDSEPTDAEQAIRSFVTLIRRLPASARSLWDEASSRDLSIGIESGTTPHSFEVALTAEALGLAASVGARVLFVVYPPAAPSSR